ncbi:MAG TPA: hypothetical protein ENK47_03330, partial [Euryarchaeota archaeon]|nr:hypothetical protein [Euryarchaeota archaeon]
MVRRSDVKNHPMRRFLMMGLIFLMTAGALVYVPETADAIDYEFSVDSEEVRIKVLTDGRAVIRYILHFTNYGTGFDVVDIGMPNHKFDLDSAHATVTVKRSHSRILHQDTDPKIKRSWYVYPGVEVHVNAGDEPIIILDFSITCDWMVWESPNNKDLASVQFRPTWFGSSYQIGPTRKLAISINLPVPMSDANSVIPDERGWDTISSNDYGVLLNWTFYDKSPEDIESGYTDVGCAFPKGYVDNYYRKNLWVSFQFFIHDVIGMVWMNKEVSCICGGLISVSIFVGLLLAFSMRRSKDYFRPSISPPGAPPRTGLTAPEAALVLELPLDRVVEMIVFGMLRKGAITTWKDDEKLRITKKWRDVLTEKYELDLYDAVDDDGRIDRWKLESTLEDMIKETERKMRGFSLRKTKDHYRNIVKMAWKEIENCSSLEEMDLAIERNGDWLPLDKEYRKKMGDHVHVWFMG